MAAVAAVTAREQLEKRVGGGCRRGCEVDGRSKTVTTAASAVAISPVPAATACMRACAAAGLPLLPPTWPQPLRARGVGEGFTPVAVPMAACGAHRRAGAARTRGGTCHGGSSHGKNAIEVTVAAAKKGLVCGARGGW